MCSHCSMVKVEFNQVGMSHIRCEHMAFLLYISQHTRWVCRYAKTLLVCFKRSCNREPIQKALRVQVENVCQARHMYELSLPQVRQQIGVVTHNLSLAMMAKGLTTFGMTHLKRALSSRRYVCKKKEESARMRCGTTSSIGVPHSASFLAVSRISQWAVNDI